MSSLALLAALLVAVAPVVSRALQAAHPAAHAAMPMGASMMAPMATEVPAGAGHHGLAATHAEGHSQAPADPHASHGQACDYCVIAAQLLPWLAVLLVLAAPLQRLVPQLPRIAIRSASPRWPAHPAQGPPLLSC